MGKQNDFRALVRQFGYGGFDRVNSGEIGDSAVFHRDVQVHTHEHAFSGNVEVIKGAEDCHGVSFKGVSGRSGFWMAMS